MNEVELEDMERVTLYTYVCSYLLLKERIQELYMFRIRSTRSTTSGSHNLVNSAKLKALFQSDCSIFRNIRSRRYKFAVCINIANILILLLAIFDIVVRWCKSNWPVCAAVLITCWVSHH